MIYVFWTCRNKAEAKTIIHALLAKRLIACASIFPEIESIYRWQGAVEESQETKVILKTQARHFETIRMYIEEHCSYEVPEIVEVDAARVSAGYLSWVVGETESVTTS